MDIMTDVIMPIFRDTSKQLMPLIPLILLAVLVLAAAYLIFDFFYRKGTYYKATHNPYLSVRFDLGKYGEYLIYKELRHLEKAGARFLFNAYIPKEDGDTTEIDVIMICGKGVFVFESKNYSGWIFGSEKQTKWTQTLPRGRGKGKSQKEQFFNPIMQNKTHIKYLRSLVGDDVPAYSVIVFSDRCTLKDITVNNTDIPVINLHDISATVTSVCERSSESLTETTVNEIYSKLYPLTQVDDKVKADHIARINDKTAVRKKSESPIEDGEIETKPEPVVTALDITDTAEPTPDTDECLKCPKCGSDLVLRIAKKGDNAGKQFYGCSAYPKCRYIRK